MSELLNNRNYLKYEANKSQRSLSLLYIYVYIYSYIPFSFVSECLGSLLEIRVP